MTTKLFLFRDVLVTSAKVSHGVFVGLPSTNSLTGLNRHLCIRFAEVFELPYDSFQPSGALLAIEGYHLEGYKKGHKAGTATYEAIPAAWASFTAHIGLEIEAKTQAAIDALAHADILKLAGELLEKMSLCKGRLNNVKAAVNLQKKRLDRFGSERLRALHCLPAASMVIRDCSELVRDMREDGLNLMEGLVAASMPHAQRPALYREFFEKDERDIFSWYLAPIMSGIRVLEKNTVSASIRQDVYGNAAPSSVGSPAFTLARLQKAASIRLRWNDTDTSANPGNGLPVFWKEHANDLGYFYSAY